VGGGRGWYNDAWPDPAFPTRLHLDRAAGGRPVYLRRKDGHSAWVSSAALAWPASIGPRLTRLAVSSTETLPANRRESFVSSPWM